MQQSREYQGTQSPIQQATHDLRLIDLTVLKGGLTVIELNESAKSQANSAAVARVLQSVRDIIDKGSLVMIDLKGFRNLNDDWRESLLALIVKAGPITGLSLSNPGSGLADKLTGFGCLFRIYQSVGEAYQALGVVQTEVDQPNTDKLTQAVLANLEQKHSPHLTHAKMPTIQASLAEQLDPQLEIFSTNEKTTVRVVSAHLPDNIVSLKFSNRLGEIMRSEAERIVVDLGAVKSIGAYAVGALVAAYKTGKSLVVVNVPPAIFQIFVTSRLSTILDIRREEN